MNGKNIDELISLAERDVFRAECIASIVIIGFILIYGEN